MTSTADNKVKKWYALYVNVRHEKKVLTKLLEKGIEAYLPIVKQMRQWSDRKKMVEVPLFTGYVFVNVSAGEMDKPRWVEGVINYLRFDGRPAVVRDEEIKGLKFFVEKGFNVETEPVIFKTGQKIKMNLAQFKDFEGWVEKLVEDDFVLVCFEGIRQNLHVRVPVGAVKAIND